MRASFWVELPDGSLVRKSADAIRDEDLVIVDSPDAFAEADSAHAKLEAEIEGAGGLENWRIKMGTAPKD
jgi:hypothetical protein